MTTSIHPPLGSLAARLASDDDPSPPRHEPDAPPRRWGGPAALAAWLALNVGMLVPEFSGAVPAGGRPASPLVSVLLALPSALVLAAVGLAAFRLTKRYTLTRRGLGRTLGVHVAAAIGLALLNTAVRNVERLFVSGYGPAFTPARDDDELAAVLFLYTALALVAHALEYARRYRERQLAGLRLQASLARAGLDRAEAELRVLKLQLNPHFLFNSLHAVSALVRPAPAAAERMMVRLCDLLRHAVSRAATQEVPLDEEVRTLQPFLEIEEIRLDGRLRVEWRIDPDVRGAFVPHMVLQPLVENAIKHGLAARAQGGTVQVAARRRGPWLLLEVRDDGVGLDEAARRYAPGAGIGTANTRARLAHLYGPRHALEIAPAEGGGTRVSVRIPFHDAPWPTRALERPVTAPASAGGWGWAGRAASAVVFLILWQRAYVGTAGTPVDGGRIAGVAEAAVTGALNAAALTLLLSAAFILARRTPVAPGARAAVGRHARAALALGAVMTLVRNGSPLLWGTPVSTLFAPAEIARMVLGTLPWMGVYAAASLVAHALEYARRGRQSEAAALALQASLARAELERTSAELRGLKMQINPAFLFTALGAVASRVHNAPFDAERMVVRLSDLLRQAMLGGGEYEVPLEEEVRALEPFLEVERIRLEGRLRVEVRVDDEALDGYVPQMVLQPLVVDAIHRGEAAGAPVVAVRARRRDGWLEMEVRGGLSPAAEAEQGEAVMRARLARLYGAECVVEVARAEGGTRTLLRLPWHEEPWPSAAHAGEESR